MNEYLIQNGRSFMIELASYSQKNRKIRRSLDVKHETSKFGLVILFESDFF